MNPYTSPTNKAISTSVGSSTSFMKVLLRLRCPSFGLHSPRTKGISAGIAGLMRRTLRSRAKEISDDPFGFRRSSDFKADWLTAGLNNNLEGQERTALTLQIDKAGELGEHLRSGLKAIHITQRQGRDIANRPTNGIQNRTAALSHFGLSERTGYGQFHENGVGGWLRLSRGRGPLGTASHWP